MKRLITTSIGLWVLLVLFTNPGHPQSMEGDICTKGTCESGFGSMLFANDDKYIGQWKDGQFHGKGVYYGSDGTRYDGQYVDGMKEGTGTYWYRNGTKYVGEWKNGWRDGYGTLYRGKSILYKGYWTDDRMMLP